MWDKIDSINWKTYQFRDSEINDIPTLLRGLVDQNPNHRLFCMMVLSMQITRAYKEATNDLPSLIAPILVELLEQENVPDLAVILDNLIEMASFSNPRIVNEPHKSLARRIKTEVCKGLPLYKRLLTELSTGSSNSIALADLINICENDD